MNEGVDCSGYTWQLYRSLGWAYDRFLGTMELSKLTRANGLHQISFEDARAGDLLVYGYRDKAGRWRGHVVILVDKDGGITGHKGLVLGAQGGSVGEVQYVTFTGFDKGYFKDPQMRLANVLRVDGITR
jgi:cell wall-associated NlpC family hydrolase